MFWQSHACLKTAYPRIVLCVVSQCRCGSTFCGTCFLNFIAAFAERYGGVRESFDASSLLREWCGDFDVFSQIDYEPGAACIFPQVTFLHTIIRALPNACFVLNTRPINHWLTSVDTFPNDFRERLLASCPIYPADDVGLANWHLRHIQRARAAMRTLRCALEVDLESPTAGDKVAHFFNGSSAACWQKTATPLQTTHHGTTNVRGKPTTLFASKADSFFPARRGRALVATRTMPNRTEGDDRFNRLHLPTEPSDHTSSQRVPPSL